MSREKEVEIIKDEEEIEEIIEIKIKNKKIIFVNYYWDGIDLKGISHNRTLEIFPQFEKVYFIEIERLKKGDFGYELFYKINDKHYFSIATIPKDKNVLIIHAIEIYRNLDYRFNN